MNNLRFTLRIDFIGEFKISSFNIETRLIYIKRKVSAFRIKTNI